MEKDDEKAREERADELRREIDEALAGDRRKRPRSPRDFIAEQMRERERREEESEEQSD